MEDRFKFRIFYNNKMVYPNSWNNIESIYECLKQQVMWDSAIDTDIKFNHIANNLIFMQCTGLTDKNNKLIYEGDIVSDKTNHIRIVLWENGGFKFPALKTSRYYHKPIKNKLEERQKGIKKILTFQDSISKKDKKEFVIIGNIYENEELLKD